MRHEVRHRIVIRPERVLQILTLIAASLGALNLIAQFVRYQFRDLVPPDVIHLFDLNREANLPTLFSVSILALAAGLLAVIATLTRQLRRPFAPHWGALAAIFVLLAIDEFVQLHELVSFLLARWLSIGDVRAYYLWVIPALGLGLVGGAAFVRFLRQLPGPLRVRMLLAAGMFVGGAVGLEIIAGVHAVFYGITNLPHALIFTAEELLEMLGVITLIWALLRYLEDLGGTQHFQVDVLGASRRVPARGDAPRLEP